MSSAPDADDQLGVLLLRGQVPEVSAWVRTGVVPVTVAPLSGWTVVVVDGPPLVEAPYDNPSLLLAARRVPRRLRPALGFFVIDGRAVVTVQDGRRHAIRWVVWDPARGVVQPPGLKQARPASLVTAAGGGRRAEVVEILAERQHAPRRILAAVATVLELPGASLMVNRANLDDLDGAIAREPDEAHLAYFEDAVRDAVLLRQELEQL